MSSNFDPRRFVEAVPDHFRCIVCHEVPVEPFQHTQLRGCDVIMCKSCKDKFSNIQACPCCRLGRVCSDFTPMNRILRVNYFDAMKLRCKYCPECEVITTISGIAWHEKQCPYSPVSCPVPGCAFVTTRSELAQHIYNMGIQHIDGLLKLCVSDDSKCSDNIICLRSDSLIEELGDLEGGEPLFGTNDRRDY